MQLGEIDIHLADGRQDQGVATSNIFHARTCMYIYVYVVKLPSFPVHFRVSIAVDDNHPIFISACLRRSDIFISDGRDVEPKTEKCLQDRVLQRSGQVAFRV